MTEQEIQQIIEKQRKFFESGKTLPVAFRKENLKKSCLCLAHCAPYPQ